MVGLLSDERGGRAALKPRRAPIRNWRAAYAGQGAGVTWQPERAAVLILAERATETSGVGRITVDRHRFSHDRAAASPAAPITLSLLAHAATLLAFMPLVPSRAELRDIAGAASVTMLFEPAPAALPAATLPSVSLSSVAPPSAAEIVPPAPHDLVPADTEPSHPQTPTEPPSLPNRL